MKRVFIIFVSISFYSLFPAAHNHIRENQQQRVQILWGLFLAGRLQAPFVPWQGIAGEPVQGKRRARRGDKHKKPLFTPQYGHYCNNNRVDRPTHAQCNTRLIKPRDRKY